MNISTSIALLIFSTLTLIACLHAYWAMGGKWPGRDDETLANIVIGTKGLTKLPKASLTVLVALLIFIAGLIPMLWANAISQTNSIAFPLPTVLISILEVMNGLIPIWFLKIAMTGLILIFLGRGVVTYTPWAEQQDLEEPFRSLDKKYYAPLCLTLGIGLMVLLLS
jgi:hypothetical protein